MLKLNLTRAPTSRSSEHSTSHVLMAELHGADAAHEDAPRMLAVVQDELERVGDDTALNGAEAEARAQSPPAGDSRSLASPPPPGHVTQRASRRSAVPRDMRHISGSFSGDYEDSPPQTLDARFNPFDEEEVAASLGDGIVDDTIDAQGRERSRARSTRSLTLTVEDKLPRKGGALPLPTPQESPAVRSLESLDGAEGVEKEETSGDKSSLSDNHGSRALLPSGPSGGAKSLERKQRLPTKQREKYRAPSCVQDLEPEPQESRAGGVMASEDEEGAALEAAEVAEVAEVAEAASAAAAAGSDKVLERKSSAGSNRLARLTGGRFGAGRHREQVASLLGMSSSTRHSSTPPPAEPAEDIVKFQIKACRSLGVVSSILSQTKMHPFETVIIYLYGTAAVYGDAQKGWNRSYDKARQIFASAGSPAIAVAMKSEHKMLFVSSLAITSKSRTGVLRKPVRCFY